MTVAVQFDSRQASADYTAQEMIVVAGAKVLVDKKVVFVGTGLPMVASLLAKLTHAPGLISVFEAGAVGPPLLHGLPLSVGDSKTFPGETIESIQVATGFELLVAPDVTEFLAPTVQEISMTREHIDPAGVFVKRTTK